MFLRVRGIIARQNTPATANDFHSDFPSNRRPDTRPEGPFNFVRCNNIIVTLRQYYRKTDRGTTDTDGRNT